MQVISFQNMYNQANCPSNRLKQLSSSNGGFSRAPGIHVPEQDKFYWGQGDTGGRIFVPDVQAYPAVKESSKETSRSYAETHNLIPPKPSKPSDALPTLVQTGGGASAPASEDEDFTPPGSPSVAAITLRAGDANDSQGDLPSDCDNFKTTAEALAAAAAGTRPTITEVSTLSFALLVCITAIYLLTYFTCSAVSERTESTQQNNLFLQTFPRFFYFCLKLLQHFFRAFSPPFKLFLIFDFYFQTFSPPVFHNF